MTTARVGETRLPKNFKRYAKQFSLLEIDCEPGTVPGKSRLEACAAAAPAGFVFSLVVPSRVASLESGADVDRAWKASQSVARILRPRWWVVRTPPEARPTRRVRESLASLVARLKDDGMRVAWEPRGVWDETAAGETADAIGATLVTDIAREAPRPGSVLYARLLALGKGGRVSLSLADVVAARVSAYEEAFVVVEGQGAREIQQALGIQREEDAAADDDELAVASSAAVGALAGGAVALGLRRAEHDEDEDALGATDDDLADEDDDDDDDFADDDDVADGDDADLADDDELDASDEAS
jgi:uncharacterized protein YecE (DUF72 family)